MKTIIFDTETTGLPLKGDQPLEMEPHIVEFGAIYLDDDHSVIRTVNQLLNPGDKIWDDKIKNFTDKLPPITTKITGITDADLVGKPTFSEFLPFLHYFFEGADLIVAHNMQFDKKLLEFEIQRVFEDRSPYMGNFPWPEHIVCSMLEYQHQFGKWPKLTEMYSKIMGKPLEQTHRAIDDVNALHEILVKDNFFAKIGEGDGS
ncbi:3'-5' exonuclease [Candidatus Pacearchaeota archaeon]|nr:3'-5' exonuclease [Candidatus Pacearchaeota archaeon]